MYGVPISDYDLKSVLLGLSSKHCSVSTQVIQYKILQRKSPLYSALK